MKWIKCEEIKPPHCEMILLCDKDANMSTGFWDNDLEEFYGYNDSIGRAIYWYKLPEKPKEII